MFRSLTKHASGVLERLGDPFFETIGQGSLSPIVGEAVEVAVRAGSPTTEAEHLLLAIANDGDSPSSGSCCQQDSTTRPSGKRSTASLNRVSKLWECRARCSRSRWLLIVKTVVRSSERHSGALFKGPRK